MKNDTPRQPQDTIPKALLGHPAEWDTQEQLRSREDPRQHQEQARASPDSIAATAPPAVPPEPFSGVFTPAAFPAFAHSFIHSSRNSFTYSLI